MIVKDLSKDYQMPPTGIFTPNMNKRETSLDGNQLDIRNVEKLE